MSRVPVVYPHHLERKLGSVDIPSAAFLLCINAETWADRIETPSERVGYTALGLMELGPPALQYEADCPKSGKYEYQNESSLHEPD